MWTGIPVYRIAGEESERLLHMEDALHERIIGQEEAIVAMSKAVRRARAGLKDPKRPIGTFIFLGPTGVGKTLARQGAGRVHVRFRRSSDQDRYVGVHGAARGRPARRSASGLCWLRRRWSVDRSRAAQVVLGHPARRDRKGASGSVQHAPPDHGRRPSDRCQGAQGRFPEHDHHHDVECRRGSDLARDEHGLLVQGRRGKDEAARLRRDARQGHGELKQSFRPEFLNRIDASIVFHSLTAEEIREIVDLELGRVRKQLAEQEIQLEVTIEAMDLLAERGYDHDLWSASAAPDHPEPDRGSAGRRACSIRASRRIPTIQVEVEDDLLKLTQAEELVGVS